MFFMTSLMAGMPSLSALKAVSTMSGWESLTAIRMPVNMVSCWPSSRLQLNSFIC